MKSFLHTFLSEKYFKIIISFYLRIKFFGFKYKCPFCHSRTRVFHSAGFSYPVLKEKNIIGAGLRPNVRCPICNSSARERLMYLFLKNKKDFFSSKKSVLHIAPERNLQKIFKSKHNISHISVDINSPYADKKMDVQNILFEDDSFNLVLCSHVLEHVIEDKKAMKEIFRVLKPGAFAILQVPISPSLNDTYEDSNIITEEDREKHFGQKDHVRIYAKEDYKKRLESVGFKVDVYNYAREFKDKAIKYSLDFREDLYVCSK